MHHNVNESHKGMYFKFAINYAIVLEIMLVMIWIELLSKRNTSIMSYEYVFLSENW